MFDNWTYTEDGQLIRPCGKPVPMTPAKGHGYLHVSYKCKTYRQHRVVFFLHNGYWADEVDHKDRDKTNNRPSNLVDSTSSANQHNRGMHNNNTSGIKGVSYNTNRQRWIASMMIEGKRTIKPFHTKQEAIDYRLKLEKDNGIS